uniref:Uncharacterized protein n=1 Tax=Kalanchoe fedtschenkoi TaxID=63787 RepID=A0A7N0TV89_KALFE
MNKKIVIRVFLDSQRVSLPQKLFGMEGKKRSDDKMRAKILKIVVRVAGVDKAEFKGSDKSQVEVEGGGRLDPIELVKKLRRNACCAELESVTPAKEEVKKEEKPKEAATTTMLPVMHWRPNSYMTVY